MDIITRTIMKKAFGSLPNGDDDVIEVENKSGRHLSDSISNSIGDFMEVLDAVKSQAPREKILKNLDSFLDNGGKDLIELGILKLINKTIKQKGVTHNG